MANLSHECAPDSTNRPNMSVNGAKPERRRKYIDFLNKPNGVCHLNEVTEFVGPKNDHQHAGDKIGQRTLKREANGKTSSTDDSDERCGLNAECANRCYDNN